MIREAIEYFKFHRKIFCDDHLKICPKDSIAYQATLKEKEFYDMAIKALEQESFINKPCVSSGVCEHDKNVVIDKIRAEIAEIPKKYPMTMDYENGLKEALTIINKYKAESEDKE